MGLETVLDEIRQKGQQQEAQILQEAKAEAARITGQAEEEATKAAALRAQETEARAQAMEREIIGASEFEARRRNLSVQRELAGDLRDRILRALSDLPAAKNEEILTTLVQRARKDILKGTVHARKADLPILEKLGYTKGEARAMAGGFIVEDVGGDVLLDLRFEVLLDDAWKQILVQNQGLFEVA
jgi:V/A-type H+-transporting ATPase subunit E